MVAVAQVQALALADRVPEGALGLTEVVAGDVDDARIQTLVEERATAKQARDFARADAIRDQLAAEGIALEDTPQGVRWKRT